MWIYLNVLFGCYDNVLNCSPFSLLPFLTCQITFFFVKPFVNENILFNLILLPVHIFTESVHQYRYNNQCTWIIKHYLFK